MIYKIITTFFIYLLSFKIASSICRINTLKNSYKLYIKSINNLISFSKNDAFNSNILQKSLDHVSSKGIKFLKDLIFFSAPYILCIVLMNILFPSINILLLFSLPILPYTSLINKNK